MPGYTVYILHSTTCNRFYTGHSQHFEHRLNQHNAGQTQSNKTCIPWSLVWKTELNSRAEAMALERKIKARGAARFLSDVN